MNRDSSSAAGGRTEATPPALLSCRTFLVMGGAQLFHFCIASIMSKWRKGGQTLSAVWRRAGGARIGCATDERPAIIKRGSAPQDAEGVIELDEQLVGDADPAVDGDHAAVASHARRDGACTEGRQRQMTYTFDYAMQSRTVHWCA